MKVSYFIGDGLAIFYRRLERGTIEVPTATSTDAKGIELKRCELSLILTGIELASVKRRPPLVASVPTPLKLLVNNFQRDATLTELIARSMDQESSALDLAQFLQCLPRLKTHVATQQATMAEQQEIMVQQRATIAARHEALTVAQEQITLLK